METIWSPSPRRGRDRPAGERWAGLARRPQALQRAGDARRVPRPVRDRHPQHVHLGDQAEGVLALEVQLGLGQPAFGIAKAPGEHVQVAEADRRLGRGLVVVTADGIGQDAGDSRR